MTATELAAGVWRLDLDGGRRAVAKRQPFAGLTRGRADDLLAVEQRVLALLGERKCPVPRVLGSDPSAGLIFFEHVGDETLDDAARSSGPGRLQRLRERLVSGFLRLEQAFADCRGSWNPTSLPLPPATGSRPSSTRFAKAPGTACTGSWGAAGGGTGGLSGARGTDRRALLPARR